MLVYAGRKRRSYSGHLELAGIAKSADSTIRRSCALIRAVLKAEHQLWNRARQRDFSIGVRGTQDQDLTQEFFMRVLVIRFEVTATARPSTRTMVFLLF